METFQKNQRDPLLITLLVIDFFLFASGAIAHWGIPIPLGFTTWNETFLIPAAILESVAALLLGVAIVSLWVKAGVSRQLVWWSLWYCFAGILIGLIGLVIGRVPEADTSSNDILHIAMAMVTTPGLVRAAYIQKND